MLVWSSMSNLIVNNPGNIYRTQDFNGALTQFTHAKILSVQPEFIAPHLDRCARDSGVALSFHCNFSTNLDVYGAQCWVGAPECGKTDGAINDMAVTS